MSKTQSLGFVGYPMYRISENGVIYGPKGRRKLSINSKGYECVCLSKNQNRKTFLVHRLVLQAFVGSCPKGHECSHINENKLDNRLNNLKWATSIENNNMPKRLKRASKSMRGKHKGKPNRLNQGSGNGRSKLYEEDVVVMRKAYKLGKASYTELASLYGVTKRTVYDAITRRTWRHI